jgi:hypothetical protein
MDATRVTTGATRRQTDASRGSCSASGCEQRGKNFATKTAAKYQMPSSPGFRHLAHAHRSERVIGGLSPAAECGGRTHANAKSAHEQSGTKQRPIGVTYD